jgi:hypothetical protein
MEGQSDPINFNGVVGVTLRQAEFNRPVLHFNIRSNLSATEYRQYQLARMQAKQIEVSLVVDDPELRLLDFRPAHFKPIQSGVISSSTER